MRSRSTILVLALLTAIGSCRPERTQEPNMPPRFGSMTPQHTLRAGEVVRDTISATDQDGDPMSFRVIDNPGFLTIADFSQVEGMNSATATLVIAPGTAQTGNYQAMVQVRDSHGAADSATCSFEVLPPPVDSVSVSPPSAMITVGATQQLTATPLDSQGNALSGRVVTWNSSQPAIAGVDADGLVTGEAEGLATITATSEGKNGTAAITVTPVPVASVEVSPATASIEIDETVRLTAVTKDADGNTLTGRAVSWSSSNQSVATVDADGLVTGVAEGSATVTATSEGTSGAAEITVIPPDGVDPALGWWHALTDFGGFRFKVDFVEGLGLLIDRRTWRFKDWTCGSATWDLTRGLIGFWYPIVNGELEVTLPHTIDPMGLRMQGMYFLFDRTDHVIGRWGMESQGTVCTGNLAGRTATPLYPHYDGTDTFFLTAGRPHEGETWVTAMPSSGSVEWKGILTAANESDIYTFYLWLGSGTPGDPDGFFDVSLLIRDGGSEQELASTTFSVPYSDVYEPFADVVTGQAGGAPGDTLVLRVTFTGPVESEPGEVLFGYHPLGLESLILVSGELSISLPQTRPLAVAAGARKVMTNIYELEGPPRRYQRPRRQR